MPRIPGSEAGLGVQPIGKCLAEGYHSGQRMAALGCEGGY